jgi:steroid delta-isomerase-like uncharacterized protein
LVDDRTTLWLNRGEESDRPKGGCRQGSSEEVDVESDAEKIAVADRWIEAYNAQDNGTMESLLGENLRIRHHNRGVDLQGRQAMMDVLEQFEGIAPDKKFHSITRRMVAGDVVISEMTWEATFTVDVPGFAAEGETVKLELCGLWEIRDGQIVQYDDYG